MLYWVFPMVNKILNDSIEVQGFQYTEDFLHKMLSMKKNPTKMNNICEYIQNKSLNAMFQIYII